MGDNAPDRIMILARPPDAGRVNRRLTPPVPAAEAVKVYQACVHDAIHTAARERGRIEVWYEDAGSGGDYYEAWFPHLRRRPQETASMVDRLVAAFDASLDDGAQRVIALPGNASVLPPRALSAAFDDLHEIDLVVGPAARHGWYLIGAREPTWPAVRAALSRFGTRSGSVGPLLRRAAAAGLASRVLPGGYRIESMDDLRRARQDAPADSNLGRWLASRAAHGYVAG